MKDNMLCAPISTGSTGASILDLCLHMGFWVMFSRRNPFFWGFVAPNIALICALLAFVLGEVTMYIVYKVKNGSSAEGE
jgi:hypothetical protein